MKHNCLDVNWILTVQCSAVIWITLGTRMKHEKVFWYISMFIGQIKYALPPLLEFANYPKPLCRDFNLFIPRFKIILWLRFDSTCTKFWLNLDSALTQSRLNFDATQLGSIARLNIDYTWTDPASINFDPGFSVYNFYKSTKTV